jgi:hypothetical protein
VDHNGRSSGHGRVLDDACLLAWLPSLLSTYISTDFVSLKYTTAVGGVDGLILWLYSVHH